MYEEYVSAIQYAASQREERLAADETGDLMSYRLEDISLEGGRIVSLSVRIRDVLPGKRVSLGVLLYETNEGGDRLARGLRTMTIPAHNEAGKRDVAVKEIRFVLPEDVSLAGTDEARQFAAQVIAHYTDIEEGNASALRA